MPLINQDRPQLQVALGDRMFATGMPLLAGDAIEMLFPAAEAWFDQGCFAVARAGDWLVGAARGLPNAHPEAAARRFYEDLFAIVTDWHPARIWNYVPAINAPDEAGIERYQAFCRGRSLAFEQHFGAEFAARLPAASCVGTAGSSHSVVFAAHREQPSNFENPRQMSAYHYPPQYGERAPSFARASRVGEAVFISGTAAIRGHESQADGDTRRQLELTMQNLVEMGRESGLGETLGADTDQARHWVIYLRHAADLSFVRERLASELRPADRVHFVESDVCRAELNVEIELSVLPGTR